MNDPKELSAVAVAEALPYGVRQGKVIWLIQHAPPPTPLCYPSDKIWREYLMYLHESGEKITRRMDIQKYQGHRTRISRTTVTVFDRIDYCQDCSAQHRQGMQAAGRCIVPA